MDFHISFVTQWNRKEKDDLNAQSVCQVVQDLPISNNLSKIFKDTCVQDSSKLQNRGESIL